GGSGEQALATAIATQMAGYYGLPNSTIAGATDSKIPDAQAGYEKALSITLAAQTGANLITQACGMQGGLMGVSFEAYVIDNDMLGAILRSASDAEVSEATLAVGTIDEVVRTEGHFLGQAETYDRMKSDFLYPNIADRRTPDEWQAAGAPDIRQVAQARARQILANHYPDHIAAELRLRLRDRFAILLDENAMRADREVY
ncbi:MAG: trimethylamine methyltransferase family protein, partial [Aestuariivirgaceae bacterium]